jgi:hypothetical protein
MNFDFGWMPGLAAPFVYPSAGNPRVAVLRPGFRETRQVRYFACIDEEAAILFTPEVLAGTAIQLRRIAARNRATTVRNAVVVFTQEGDPGLTEYDRDMFWDVFGVPAFEQYLSRRNRLIATECDVHEGLHIRLSSARREGWIRDSSPCACGDARPRLMPGPQLMTAGLKLCEQRP